MSEPTEADREVARQLLSTPPGYRGKSHVERVATALAAARAKGAAEELRAIADAAPLTSAMWLRDRADDLDPT